MIFYKPTGMDPILLPSQVDNLNMSQVVTFAPELYTNVVSFADQGGKFRQN